MRSFTHFNQSSFNPLEGYDVLRLNPQLLEVDLKLSIRHVFDLDTFSTCLVLLHHDDKCLVGLRRSRRSVGSLLLLCHVVYWDEPRWAAKLLVESTLRSEEAPQQPRK
jgi:hypothetical protein